MSYILDTHALLWFLNGDKKISNEAKIIIEKRSNKTFVSIASIWEIAVKVSINKLILSKGFEHLLDLIDSNDIKILKIKPSHLKILIDLQFIHKDPFDRLIISQAKAEHYTILTKDRFIKEYEVDVIW